MWSKRWAYAFSIRCCLEVYVGWLYGDSCHPRQQHFSLLVRAWYSVTVSCYILYLYVHDTRSLYLCFILYLCTSCTIYLCYYIQFVISCSQIVVFMCRCLHVYVTLTIYVICTHVCVICCGPVVHIWNLLCSSCTYGCIIFLMCQLYTNVCVIFLFTSCIHGCVIFKVYIVCTYRSVLYSKCTPLLHISLCFIQSVHWTQMYSTMCTEHWTSIPHIYVFYF